MKSNKIKKYHDAILSRHPNAENIREPQPGGSLGNVLFADVDDNVRVFKFSNEHLVLKNAKVSYLYNRYGIPAPRIEPQEHKKIHFEEYDAIDGITLFEAIKMGIGAEQIRQTYYDVVKLFIKMENIPREILGDGKMHYAYEIAGAHTNKTHGLLLGQLVKAMIYFASRKKKHLGLYHFDLGPKNIILSDDGQLRALIDMDSVGFCSAEFAFGMLAARYKQIGLNPHELLSQYSATGNCKINHDMVMRVAKLRGKIL